MKIFKELKKLGYKHYTENTIEELDNLPLDSEERIMEQSLVLRWFREKYGLYHIIHCPTKDVSVFTITGFDIPSVHSDVELKSYEEAELACLRKLIEIVKDGNKC